MELEIDALRKNKLMAWRHQKLQKKRKDPFLETMEDICSCCRLPYRPLVSRMVTEKHFHVEGTKCMHFASVALRNNTEDISRSQNSAGAEVMSTLANQKPRSKMRYPYL